MLLFLSGSNKQNLNIAVSKEYLDELYANFLNDKVKLFVAEDGGVVCAGILLALYGKRMVAWIGAA